MCKFIYNSSSWPFIRKFDALEKIREHISKIFKAHPKSTIVTWWVIILDFMRSSPFLIFRFFLIVMLLNKRHVLFYFISKPFIFRPFHISFAISSRITYSNQSMVLMIVTLEFFLIFCSWNFYSVHYSICMAR